MSTDCDIGDRPCRIPEREFASWEEFKGFVSADLLSSAGSSLVLGRYLFRGHGDANWPLEPRFDRTFKTLPNSERTERHKLLLDNFRRECQHFPEYSGDIEDENKCLALAQHYGLPTRLLDWTDSPYIAAYFAFNAHLAKDYGENNSGKDKKVAIWILDRTVKHYWDGDRGVEIIEPRAWHNERQKRQSGWFTKAKTPFRSLEEYVQQLGNEQNALRKVILSAGLAELALTDLDFMRISARELFADLSGAAINALVHTVLAN